MLGLVLYGLSARDASTSPDWMHRIQLAAVVSAVVLDVMVLGTMVAGSAISGSPEPKGSARPHLVLLVNLAAAAWLSARHLTGRSRLHRLERCQTSYLPVFAPWATTLVVVRPVVFGFS